MNLNERTVTINIHLPIALLLFALQRLAITQAFIFLLRVIWTKLQHASDLLLLLLLCVDLFSSCAMRDSLPQHRTFLHPTTAVTTSHYPICLNLSSLSMFCSIVVLHLLLIFYHSCFSLHLAWILIHS